MKLQVRLELPRIVAKQLGGSCTQVGEPGTWNPADPKVSHAQPPWHEAADAKKSACNRVGRFAPSFPGSPNPVAEVAATGGNLCLTGLQRKARRSQQKL